MPEHGRCGRPKLLDRLGSTSGQTATKDFTITIYNALPTITSLNPASATAGGPAFTLTVNGTNFVLDSAVQWNGSDRTTTYVSATQLKADIPATDITTSGTANVTIVNPDPGGGTSNAKAFSINSPNRPPTAQANGLYSVPEGGAASLNGSGFDPDGDQLTYAWDLDNNGSFETSGQAVTFSAAGRDGLSNQTVILQVCDNKSACATSTTTVHIDNVAPAPSISGAPGNSPEGTTISLSGSTTDPGSADMAAGFSYAWGVTKNGNAYASGTGAGFSFTPDDNGTYVATLSATDKDESTGSSSKTITVTNVAPSDVSVHVNSAAIDENGAATLSGSFTDPGTRDTHTVVISWGDGSADTTLNLAANVLTFSAAHQYLDDNPSGTPADSNTIRVTVTDKERATGNGSSSVTVNNVAPSIASLSATSMFVGPLAFGPSTVNGNIADPGTQDTHTVVISWGDGSANTTLNLAANILTFSMTHQYTSAGCKSISTTVTDDDTGAATTATTASVGTAAFLAPMTNQPITDKLRNNQVLPVKVQITDCNGNSATNLTPAIRLVEGDQTPIADDGSDTITPPSVSAADTTGYMRLVGGSYIYNMKVNLAKLNTDYTLIIYPFANQATGSLNPAVTLRHVIQAAK